MFSCNGKFIAAIGAASCQSNLHCYHGCSSHCDGGKRDLHPVSRCRRTDSNLHPHWCKVKAKHESMGSAQTRLIYRRRTKHGEASASLVFRQLVAVFDTLRTYLNSVPDGL